MAIREELNKGTSGIADVAENAANDLLGKSGIEVEPTDARQEIEVSVPGAAPAQDVQAPEQMSMMPEISPMASSHDQRAKDDGRPATMRAVDSRSGFDVDPSDLPGDLRNTSVDARVIAPADMGEDESDVDDLMPESANVLQPMSVSKPVHSAEEISAERERHVERQGKRNEDPEPEPRLNPEASMEKMDQADTGDSGDAEKMDAFKEDKKPMGLYDYEHASRRTRYAPARKKLEDDTEARVKRKVFGGDTLYGKIIGDPRLGMREVSIGTRELQELVGTPKSPIIDRVMKESGVELNPDSETFLFDLIDAINNSNIVVGTTKSPVNRGSSAQARILRIHYGTGIHLHPIMAKQYNADFDGDEMNVIFKRRSFSRFRDPMEYLIDVEGEVSLDPDFFLPMRLYNDDNVTERSNAFEYVDEVMLRGIESERDRKIVRKAIVEYCQSPSSDSLTNLARAISDVSRGMQEKRFTRMGNILFDIYDGMRELRIRQAEIIANDSGDVGPISDAMPNATGVDRILLDFVDGIVDGRPGMNMQDVKSDICAYLGEADNKNISFRITADLAKLFRIDQRISIGQMDDVLETLMTYAVSERMSNEAYAPEKQKSISDMVRSNIISEIGMPGDSSDGFRNYLIRFVNAYHDEARKVNIAAVQYQNNMAMSKNAKSMINDIRGNTFGDVAQAFVSVFGNYSIDTLFGEYVNEWDKNGRKSEFVLNKRAVGKSWIPEKYRDKTLYWFAHNNNLHDFEESLGKDISDTSVNPVLRLLDSIADMRTSAASKYNREMYGSSYVVGRSNRGTDRVDDDTRGMMGKALELVNELNGMIVNKPTKDWEVWADDLCSLLFMTGPDIFYYFGMDNFEAFVKSPYGRKMLNARTADELGSIRMAMVTEYRCSRVGNAMAKREEYVQEGRPTYMVMRVDNEIAEEMDKLASSSYAWHAIVMEMRAQAGTRAYDALASGAQSGNVVRFPSAAVLNNGEYWKNPKHDSVLEMLLDTSMPKEDKERALSDVVRWHENYLYIEGWEMSFQLEQNPDAAYSDTPRTSDSVMSVINDFNRKFDSRSEGGLEDAIRDIEDAYAMYGDTEGVLSSYLHRVSSIPGYHIRLDDGVYIDSLTSILDKVYNQSSKNRQNPSVNAIYEALNLQFNGVIEHDVSRTDDWVLGLVPIDKVTIHHIVRLLSNREYKITVYDRFGRTSVVNAATLCGKSEGDDVSEGEIWQFLRDNPRVATALRLHEIGAKGGPKSGAYMTSRANLKDSIDNSMTYGASGGYADVNKAILREHPGYGALIALLTKTRGRSAKSMRQSYIETEEALVDTLTYIAAKMAESGAPSRSIVAPETVEGMLGVNLEQMIGSFEWQDGELERDHELYGDMSTWEDACHTCYDLVIDLVNKYVNEIYERGSIDRDAELPIAMFDGELEKESIAAFYDMRQELNAAKTQVSTGIEGQESWELGAWLSLLAPTDKYTIPDTVSVNELTTRFNGCMTSAGVRIGSVPFSELSEELGDEFVIEVPAGYVAQDKTTNRFYETQMSSVSVYLLVKRDNGAEKFNLKVKKFGDDGSDSIIKHFRFGKRDEHGLSFDDILKNIRSMVPKSKDSQEDADAREAGLMAAKMYLAKLLMAENVSLGYKDMDIANYCCISDLMILDTGDDVYLRSLEQIACTIRNQIPFELIEDVDNRDGKGVERLRQAAADIASRVGTETMGDPVDALSELRIYGNSPIGMMSGSTVGHSDKRYSSSWARNYDLVKEISDAYVADAKMGGIANPHIPGAEEIGSAVDWMRESYKALYDKMRPNDANLFKPGHSLSSYKWTGVIGGPCHGLGPECLWILDGKSLPENYTKEQIRRDLLKAYRRGVTVMVTSPDLIPDYLAKDAIPFPSSRKEEGDPQLIIDDVDAWMIPFFEIRLNGCDSNPHESRMAIFRGSRDGVVTGYEDSNNEHALGDAGVKFFKSLVDRTNVNWSDCARVRVDDMFCNVRKAYPNAITRADFAERDKIVKYVINNETDNGERYTIDYGVTESSKLFAERKRLVDDAIGRYRQRFMAGEADESGFMMDGNKPGDIVAFADMEIEHDDGTVEHCLAPIIPFELKDTFETPSRYSIVDMDQKVDGVQDPSAFEINWVFTDDLRYHYFKVFEWAGAANKLMGSFADAEDGFSLGNGMPIDMCYARESTVTRRGGTNKRIKTMEALMYMIRSDGKGHNFAADCAESFPFDPDVKNDLSTRRIMRDEWKKLLDDGIVFHGDPSVNAFVDQQVRAFYANDGNPSDFLANRFGDYYTDVYWEFPCMFRQSYSYEDDLLKFIHSMRPDLCPNGINGEYDKDKMLFRVCHDDGFDFGCLQARIPHRSSDDPNTVWYSYENLYAGFSFFGEEFSGFHRPNINGATDTIEAINTMAVEGKLPGGYRMKNYLLHSVSDVGKVPQSWMIGTDLNGINGANRKAKRISEIRNGGKPFTVAFTGQNPKELFGGKRDKNMYESLRDAIIFTMRNDIGMELNGMRVITGGAQGADQLAASAVEMLKEHGFEIENLMYIPYEGQEEKWNKKGMFSREMYWKRRENADKVVNVSGKTSPPEYNQTRDLRFRNTAMVSEADVIIAIHESAMTWNPLIGSDDERKGGTADAVRKALRYGKAVILLDPNTGETSKITYEDMIKRTGGQIYVNAEEAPFAKDSSELSW